MKITGNRIIITDERNSDPKDYFRWFNLEEWQYYDRPDQPFKPISQEQFEELAKQNQERYDERVQDKSKPKPGLHIDTIDGKHLGWVSIYSWDQTEKSTHIGIAIPEEEHWGKGYGTEALGLYINYLFCSFDLNMIQATTWTGNKGMVRCAQKLGLTNEKIIPHQAPLSVRGEPLERIEFSMSRLEWLKRTDGC
jgi:RimJ/RimL family protein N-acetyltransferase